MKLSARNVLQGRVTGITSGSVNDEIIMELKDGVEVVPIITRESAENLKLEIGKEACAVIKASNVMIAID